MPNFRGKEMEAPTGDEPLVTVRARTPWAPLLARCKDELDFLPHLFIVGLFCFNFTIVVFIGDTSLLLVLVFLVQMGQ